MFLWSDPPGSGGVTGGLRNNARYRDDPALVFCAKADSRGGIREFRCVTALARPSQSKSKPSHHTIPLESKDPSDPTTCWSGDEIQTPDRPHAASEQVTQGSHSFPRGSVCPNMLVRALKWLGIIRPNGSRKRRNCHVWRVPDRPRHEQQTTARNAVAARAAICAAVPLPLAEVGPCALLRDKQTRPRLDGSENKRSLARLQPLDPHFKTPLAAFLKSPRFIKYLPGSAGKVSGNAGVIPGQAGDASWGPASINLCLGWTADLHLSSSWRL